MRICSTVVLSYSDADIGPRCPPSPPKRPFLRLLLLLLAAKIHCPPWTLKWVVRPPLGKTQLGHQDLQLGPSWVLSSPDPGWEMAQFSPQNGQLHDTTAGERPHWTPICNHLIAESLWKKNGPHWRHLHDTLATVLDVQNHRPENRWKTTHFYLKNGPLHGTTACHLMVQSLWKKNGP